MPAGEAEIEPERQAAEHEDGGEERRLQAEREPEPVLLAELGEPVALERDPERRLEYDDRHHRRGDIGKVPVEAVEHVQRRRSAAVAPDRPQQRNRGDGDQDQVAEQEHEAPPRGFAPRAYSSRRQDTFRANSAWRAKGLGVKRWSPRARRNCAIAIASA